MPSKTDGASLQGGLLRVCVTRKSDMGQCELYMLGMAVFEPVLVGPRVHRPSGTGAGRSGR